MSYASSGSDASCRSPPGACTVLHVPRLAINSGHSGEGFASSQYPSRPLLHACSANSLAVAPLSTSLRSILIAQYNVSAPRGAYGRRWKGAAAAGDTNRSTDAFVHLRRLPTYWHGVLVAAVHTCRAREYCRAAHRLTPLTGWRARGPPVLTYPVFHPATGKQSAVDTCRAVQRPCCTHALTRRRCGAYALSVGSAIPSTRGGRSLRAPAVPTQWNTAVDTCRAGEVAAARLVPTHGCRTVVCVWRAVGREEEGRCCSATGLRNVLPRRAVAESSGWARGVKAWVQGEADGEGRGGGEKMTKQRSEGKRARAQLLLLVIRMCMRGGGRAHGACRHTCSLDPGVDVDSAQRAMGGAVTSRNPAAGANAFCDRAQEVVTSTTLCPTDALISTPAAASSRTAVPSFSLWLQPGSNTSKATLCPVTDERSPSVHLSFLVYIQALSALLGVLARYIMDPPSSLSSFKNATHRRPSTFPVVLYSTIQSLPVPTIC
ncbi:hypothetical protein DFH06DRAFT_1136722 [Mycena polygramma]|nr:hypothetical protein DFH06DRAFT_1136722 [Mycena polygramma]